MFNVTLKPEK